MKTKSGFLGKTLVAVAVAFAMGSSVATAAFPDFGVTEGNVPGAVANTFVADKITGNYTEVITFTGAGTFNVSLLWNAGQFVGNDGNTPVGNQLGSVTPNQYGLYALYQASGTFATVGAITTFTTTAGSGALSVYIDPTSNTTFVAPATGAGAFGVGANGDDYLIATGTPGSGTGTLDPTLPTCGGGINCGSFGTSSSFLLTDNGTTSDGQSFFTSPVPFYSVSFQSGQLNLFTPTGTQTINGSLDVVFAAVPEPTSLALLGIGLLGLAGGLRRRSKA